MNQKTEDKIVVYLLSDGSINAEFPENHFSKRQLMRVLKSIKLGYRRNVREYRKQIMKGVKDGQFARRRTETKTEGARTEGATNIERATNVEGDRGLKKASEPSKGNRFTEVRTGEGTRVNKASAGG